MFRNTVPVLAFLLLLQACTTTSIQSTQTRSRSTAMDRAISSCVGGVIIGVAAGALLGKLTGGNRGAKRGAVIGAAGGVGRCAILLKLASTEDKRRARAAELAAVRRGTTATSTIRTSKGENVKIKTVVTPTQVPTNIAKLRVKKKSVAKRKIAPKPSAKPKSLPVPAPETNTVEEKATVPKYTACRNSATQISDNNQSTNVGKQLWCRNVLGDWEPIAL